MSSQIQLGQRFKCDFLIIGSGIVGLAIARELKQRYPRKHIIVIDKEDDVARHGSGRNSGVLHAGFYYTENSLKAKFTVEGNRLLREYCQSKGIKVNECGKVVVTRNERELESLFELERRGKKNGSTVRIVDERELAEIEPNARTFQKALHSPKTATVNPIEVSRSIRAELKAAGVEFLFGMPYRRRLGANAVEAGRGSVFEADRIVNSAGLYADRIAKDFGFSSRYAIVPFKGIYLKYSKPLPPVRTNVYPVPNLKNPFLGVHFTVTVDGKAKIGPTAIPAFWRENYQGFSRFKWTEMAEILRLEALLFLKNKFNFRELAFEEMRKYQKAYFVKLASEMVRDIDPSGFTEWSPPGIRAQLLNLDTFELVQDFVVEGDRSSTHVLNAVSPAFTSSFPFARWVVEQHLSSDEA